MASSHSNEKGLAESAANFEGFDNKGHRERLKSRFQADSGASFKDTEFLELVLFRSIPRRDTKPIARRLIHRFGSFSEVLSAPENLLLEVKGVGQAVVLDLKLIKAAGEKLARGALQERTVLNSWTALLEYCRTTMGLNEIEQFRVLFLDKKNNLLRDEVFQEGTIDHTPVYPREVIKRALELSSSALILVHNHPSGDPTPSTADITMTKELDKIASSMSIKIHDHLIISRDKHVSLKSLNIL